MPNLCKVCSDPSHGRHFGVISCRACAAFFRRAANSKWTKMECLSRHCTRENLLCKPCRLKKCLEVGMDDSKFQHNRDSIVASRRLPIPVTLEQFVRRPAIVIFTQISQPCAKTFVNLSPLISKAKRILEVGCESPLVSRSHLGKLSYAIGCLQMDKRPKPFDKLSEPEVSDLWEFYLTTTARWLTYFEPFQELEDSMKIHLVLSIWHVWNRLHKIVATALYRTRNKSAKPDERVLGNGVVNEHLIYHTDISWMTRYSVEHVIYFLDGIRVGALFGVIDEMGNREFSEVELTFMLAQLCFQYASGRFGGKVSEVMERFQEILTNDLHSYYIEERNPRYADRLIKMLKINNAIQENIREQRNRAEIAKVFGIFRVDFSHPEMFRDTGLN